MYCSCIFFNLPPKGKFTMEKECSCEYNEKGILLYDDNIQPVFFEHSEYELYCHFYAGPYDPPIDPTDETQDQSLYMVLEYGKPSIREIRAYSHICKVNYVAAKKLLHIKKTLWQEGTTTISKRFVKYWSSTELNISSSMIEEPAILHQY